MREEGALFPVSAGYTVTVPDVVIRPIPPADCSVNHRAPSDPAVMPMGMIELYPSEYSVTTPEVVIRAIALPFVSVNQTAPSGPAVMPLGKPPRPGGRGYSVKTPAVLIRPTRLWPPSVNHSAPSDPAAIQRGRDVGRRQRVLGEPAGWADSPDLVRGLFGEPHRPIGPQRDADSAAAGCSGRRIFRNRDRLRQRHCRSQQPNSRCNSVHILHRGRSVASH